MRPLLPPFWFVAAKSISPRPPTSLLDSLFLSVNRQSVVPCSVQQDSHVPLSPRNTFIEIGCATQLNLNETMENRGRGIKEEVGGRLFFLTFFSSFYLIFIILFLVYLCIFVVENFLRGWFPISFASKYYLINFLISFMIRNSGIFDKFVYRFLWNLSTKVELKFFPLWFFLGFWEIIREMYIFKEWWSIVLKCIRISREKIFAKLLDASSTNFPQVGSGCDLRRL